jgi:hypothetical protein
VVRLDRISADEVTAEALELGYTADPPHFVPETEQHLGSTVVMLRAPAASRRPRTA